MGVLKTTWQNWQKDRTPMFAAAISFYALFAAGPLFFLILMIFSLLAPSLGENVQIIIGSLLGDPELVDALVSSRQLGDDLLFWVVGLVFLLFGASRLVIQIQNALNILWGAAPKKRNFFVRRAQAVLIVLGIALFVLISILSRDFIAGLLPGTIFTGIIYYLSTLIIIAGGIFALFYVLPSCRPPRNALFIGALFSGFLFLAGQSLFQLYLYVADPAAAFKAASSVILLLLWMYYSALVFLLGAELTKSLWKKS